ncbi:hypothetical protein FSP39_000662 [Pinctada imbricata]|uniref:Uncharacterized protein n=1 Tax=Pinctada imbricata TaxID=66713 RepID=A0AA88XM21_PINIB|nr:hypothetical protein FSP39_000662 [Pinctada imbricata]
MASEAPRINHDNQGNQDGNQDGQGDQTLVSSQDNQGDNGEADWSDCDQDRTKKKKDGGRKKLKQLSLYPSNVSVSRKRKKRLSSNGQSDSELSEINEELKHINMRLNGLVTKDELKALVDSSVQLIVNQLKPEIRKEIKAEMKKEMRESKEIIRKELQKDVQKEVKKEVKSVEQLVNEKLGKFSDRCDGIDLDIENMKENIAKQARQLNDMHETLKGAMNTAFDALKLANHNQQYSQKNNIKILNWREKNGENSETLRVDFISEMLKVGVTVSDSDILAIHRVPTKNTRSPRPVILKLIRSDVRLNVIRKRKEVAGTFKMMDHVTERNLDLMNRLRDNDNLHSVWYYNCNIHAIDMVGDRHRFDIGDNSEKLRRIGAAVRRAGITT